MLKLVSCCRTLLHLSTPSTAGHTAVEDLAAAVSALTNTSKLFQQSQGTELSQVSSSNSSNQPAQQAASGRRPAALLAVFFNQACQGHAEFPEGLPANVVACSAPDGSLDPDSAIKHAKESFAKLYPDDVSVFEPAHSSNPDADSDDEALDALSGVLQNLDPA